MTTESYDIDPTHAAEDATPDPIRGRTASSAAQTGPTWLDRVPLAQIGTIAVCLAHAALIWFAMGGRAGWESPWPPLHYDHGFQFHHGYITSNLLRQTGTTAGYDPSFMSGFAMSVLSGQSTTMTDLAMILTPGRPVLGYKLNVFVCAAATPWLIALAALALRARSVAVFLATLFFVIFFWTDAPKGYVQIGMSPYLLSVPLGLVTVIAVAAYLDRGGFGRWVVAAGLCSLVFLIHITSPMVVAPAGALAYLAVMVRGRRVGRPVGWKRHLGLWGLLPVILLANIFWWLPGASLLSTQGPPGITPFAHPEPVLGRLADILWENSPIEALLVGSALVGLPGLIRRNAVATAALVGFALAGLSWGFLAGWFRSLDPIQPGRHTFALFAALCVMAGLGLGDVLQRLRAGSGMIPGPRLDRLFAVLMLMLLIRLFGAALNHELRELVFTPSPILTSVASPRAAALVELIRRNVAPGERLLFEETGLGINEPEPYGGRHLSSILPWLTGAEVIGGPNLHMALTTNFTQFGEAKLFGMKDWDRAQFVRYARLYRPAAIVCWSQAAKRFCLANPDLVRVVDASGPILVGRVLGFEGSTITGQARVEARPGRLTVRDAVPDPESGRVVLRYHVTPWLRVTPPAVLEPIALEGDPVPFIGLRNVTSAPIEIELVAPPAAWWRGGQPGGGGTSTTAR